MFISASELANKIAASGSNTALFLDLDGTLIEYANKPDQTIIAPDLEHDLINLSKHFKIAIITGRSEAFINKIFPELIPAFSASHGAVIKYESGGRVEQLVPDVNTKTLRVKLGSENLAAGMWVEETPFSCNIHWRESTLSEEENFKIAEDIAKKGKDFYNDPLSAENHIGLTYGSKVIELGPHGANKGMAIQMFMAHENFQGCVPIFAGDSKADIPGFEVVNSLNELTIGVGSNVDGHTQVAVASPQEFRTALKILSHGL